MTSERGGLTKERIVRAGVTLIERDGLDKVTMRRLAAELGVGTMSLYNHVPNKAALLDAIAEFILTDMEFAADPNADWRDQARGLARTLRDIARRYPRSTQVVITRQPWSTAGLRPVEIALAAVRGAGFDGAVAVRLVRTFVSFVLGSLMSEVGANEAQAARRGAPSAAGLPLPDQAEQDPPLDLADYPNIRDLLPVLVEHDSERDFEFGLELLISAMAALAEARTANEHPLAAGEHQCEPG